MHAWNNLGQDGSARYWLTLRREKELPNERRDWRFFIQQPISNRRKKRKPYAMTNR
jgi:hypothetical protein